MHQLPPELIGLDDRVEDEIGGEPLEVDILLIFTTLVLHELLTLGRIRDLADLVGVDGIDCRLRTHHRDPCGG